VTEPPAVSNSGVREPDEENQVPEKRGRARDEARRKKLIKGELVQAGSARKPNGKNCKPGKEARDQQKERWVGQSRGEDGSSKRLKRKRGEGCWGKTAGASRHMFPKSRVPDMNTHG